MVQSKEKSTSSRHKTIYSSSARDTQKAVSDLKQDQDTTGRMNALEDRLKHYSDINVANLIQELANKTCLLEEFIQEKRDRYLLQIDH